MEQTNEVKVAILRVFVKDVSLEMPNAPQCFTLAGAPEASLNVNLEVQDLGNNAFCVNIRGTLTGNVGDKPFYLLEIEQSGIFEVQATDDLARRHFLFINAPQVLTGYLRANISDMLMRASLPQFFMPDLDWAKAISTDQTVQQPTE